LGDFWAKTHFLHFKPFQSGQNQLPPFQAIQVRAKNPTSSIASHSSRDKNDFLHSTFFILSHSSWVKTNFLNSFHYNRAKTDLFYSKPLQSGQKQLPPFQAITVMPKPTSSIPSHYSQAKTDLLNSKPFQSSQKQFPPFQSIPVGLI
jgi:hypothetical protein